MPFLQAMAERANELFSRENISKVNPAPLAEPSLGALASGLGIARYEVDVWESRSVKNSIGAITLLLRSPYPDVG